MTHPLLNPNSKHYDTDKRASIYDFEATVSVGAMVDVCNFEIFKYTSRLGKKEIIVDDVVVKTKEQVAESDLENIAIWKEYKELLMIVIHNYSKLTVRQAFDEIYPQLKYRLGE